MEENWLPVLNYEGLYEVSDLGRVRSLDREVWNPAYSCYQTRKGRIIKQYKIGHEGNKYFAVNLSKEGLAKHTKVHIMVLEAFLCPRPAGLYGLHGDKGRFDNSLPNLSWGTHSQNMGDDRLRDGTLPFGENHGSAKLTNDKVLEIYRLAWEGNLTQKEIAEMFNVSSMNVSYIKNGKTQSRITGHLNTPT